MKIFGFEIRRPKSEKSIDRLVATDASDNNASAVMADGVFGYNTSVAMDSNIATENGYIEEYRRMAYDPEVKQCIAEIVSDAIVHQSDGAKAVEIDLNGTELSDKSKELITNEFENIYNMLDFDTKGHEIFKRWYVDGRLNYIPNIDMDSTKDGILSIQYVDPRKIKKIKKVKYDYNKKSQDVMITSETSYFLFNENGVGSGIHKTAGTGSVGAGTNSEKYLTEDSVVYVPSGQVDQQTGIVISALHCAIKTANNLRIMEDAAMIYRLARAPERRVFYVDTGNLPKAKAEQYVKKLANEHRVSAAYDSTTGQLRNDKKFMAMTEDFWLARRGNQSGTQIDTLQGGSQAGEMGEAEYFKNKLYVALGVSPGRFAEQPSMFDTGTSITRDELRMARMIDRYRASFNKLFEELLKRQLILKNICTPEEWEEIHGNFRYKYSADAHFAEALRQERIRATVDMVSSVSQYVGEYFSKEYVYRNIMNLNDEEIKDMKAQIKAEKASGEITIEEGDIHGNDSVIEFKSILESKRLNK